MTLHCDIVTQERTVFSGEVLSVNLPGAEGRMGILENHAPLITTLDFGEVVIRTPSGEEDFFAVGGGFAEVQPKKVIILADAAERADEINAERAEEARANAQRIMEEGVPQDPEFYARLEAELKLAQIRIDVSRKRATRYIPTLGADDR